ncbi:MAG TPA: hypothetical protein VFR37_05585 [Longimicrobium sp.]|nr:hypothetical protein [Longimicrobium sp.]
MKLAIASNRTGSPGFLALRALRNDDRAARRGKEESPGAVARRGFRPT